MTGISRSIDWCNKNGWSEYFSGDRIFGSGGSPANKREREKRIVGVWVCVFSCRNEINNY